MLLKEGQKIKYPDNITDLDLYQDERIFELILTNVVQNAVKYSPKKAEIKIEVFKKEDHLVIEVKDNGIGIPEEDLDKVFTRYFRAANVLNMQGTGIGLNIAKTHLENLGGSIAIESKEGVGTKVTMKIPFENYG
jgi:hypothetical protein